MHDQKLFNDFVNEMMWKEMSDASSKEDRQTECSSTNPGHYNQGTIQPWDFILDHDMGFLEGNIIKYITRYKKKGGREDLLKARTYLDKLIAVTSD